MPNQHTSTPRDWTWALEAYADNRFSADQIARLAGVSVTTLYMRANRAGIRKGRKHRFLKAGTPDRYQPDAVEAARLKDLSAQDAELLQARPLMRCDTCGNLSKSTTCHCGRLINPYIEVA